MTGDWDSDRGVLLHNRHIPSRSEQKDNMKDTLVIRYVVVDFGPLRSHPPSPISSFPRPFTFY